MRHSDQPIEKRITSLFPVNHLLHSSFLKQNENNQVSSRWDSNIPMILGWLLLIENDWRNGKWDASGRCLLRWRLVAPSKDMAWFDSLPSTRKSKGKKLYLSALYYDTNWCLFVYNWIFMCDHIATGDTRRWSTARRAGYQHPLLFTHQRPFPHLFRRQESSQRRSVYINNPSNVTLAPVQSPNNRNELRFVNNWPTF